MIGLAVITYNRPDYFYRALASVYEHLGGFHPVIDWFQSVHDGPIPDAYECPDFSLVPTPQHSGVGAAKNYALHLLLDKGCDWLFLMEDDMEILSPKAVTGYIAACEASGLGHLMFHAHGSHNGTPRGGNGPVTYWPNCVGAWCIYSSESLEACGLFDEAMVNAFEHVEHTQRLAQAGFTSPWPNNADATGSENWIREQPGAIEHSSIPQDGRSERMDASLAHWKATRSDTFNLIWPGR